MSASFRDIPLPVYEDSEIGLNFLDVFPFKEPEVLGEHEHEPKFS